LIEKGADVTALSWGDISKSVLGFEGMVDKIKFIKCDIRDYNAVNEALNKSSPTIVFHLAAQAIVGKANESPLPTFQVNVNGTLNLLEALRNSRNVEAIVVASTDKVYGEPIQLPITENHPLLATYPYDVSKACADIISRMYFRTYGLPIAVTRCCNIYGGGDLNFSRIVPDTVRSVILNRNPIIRSDGTPVRDFIHVDDAVRAYIVLAENIERKDVSGEAFNFGSNSPISILELVKKIIEISGKKLQPDIRGKGVPKGEISRQYLSSEKAKKLLNWQPEVKLEDGLKKTIVWYSKYFKWAVKDLRLSAV